MKNHVDALTAQRDAARKESIDGRKSLKEKVLGLESAQAILLEKLGIDSVEDAKTLPDAKGQAEAAKQLEARIKRLEKQVVDVTKERDDWAGKYRDAAKKAALRAAMSEYKFVDQEMTEAFIAANLEWDSDDLMYKTQDGALIPVNDGVAGLVKAKPNIVVPGAGGAGVRTGAGGGGQRNPWTKEHFNLTEQGRLLRENPQLAEQMQAAAQ